MKTAKSGLFENSCQLVANYTDKTAGHSGALLKLCTVLRHRFRDNGSVMTRGERAWTSYQFNRAYSFFLISGRDMLLWYGMRWNELISKPYRALCELPFFPPTMHLLHPILIQIKSFWIMWAFGGWLRSYILPPSTCSALYMIISDCIPLMARVFVVNRMIKVFMSL